MYSINLSTINKPIKFGNSVRDRKDDSEKSPSPQTSKVAVGLGATLLASVVLGGIYYLTKGKKGNPAPKVDFEKVFNNGNKVTSEIIDGKTILNVYDKDGKLLKTKTKEIARSANPQNGNKYVTIKTRTHTIKGDYVAEDEINKYYLKDGDKILETEVLRNIRDSKFVDSSKAYRTKDKWSIVRLAENGKRLTKYMNNRVTGNSLYQTYATNGAKIIHTTQYSKKV